MYITLACSHIFLVLILSSLGSISFFPVFYFPPHVYYYYYTISTGWMGWFRWHFSCAFFSIGYWSLDLKPQWNFDITVQLLPCYPPPFAPMCGTGGVGECWKSVGVPHTYYYYTTSTGWTGRFRLTFLIVVSMNVRMLPIIGSAKPMMHHSSSTSASLASCLNTPVQGLIGLYLLQMTLSLNRRSDIFYLVTYDVHFSLSPVIISKWICVYAIGKNTIMKGENWGWM